MKDAREQPRSEEREPLGDEDREDDQKGEFHATGVSQRWSSEVDKLPDSRAAEDELDTAE